MSEKTVEDVGPVGDRLLSGEEQVTLITESMTVTSTDQEKLLLLNKNTELRRVNKELMKLNEDWDQVYRSATLGLQHRLEALEQESSALKQLNNRLAREYYEQTLMQELKKNQDLQEYIRTLESRILSAMLGGPESCPTPTAPGGPELASSHIPDRTSPSCLPATSFTSEARLQGKSQNKSLGLAHCHIDVLCQQTQIYEAEYQTEHKDHKHTLQENRRLRKKREEMRQQVALLQEQLKVYEDDFRRERSDKQMLQRLLLKKTPAKDPVLIHRCNNEQQPAGGDKRTQSGERAHLQRQRKQHHPLCPKHCKEDSEELEISYGYDYPDVFEVK
uniref:Uncharacterized protein n=1 Tax=Myripristis murdjan TaxID=586833 RepID=A0A667Y326_9TELE